jgi:hypothetical protein
MRNGHAVFDVHGIDDHVRDPMHAACGTAERIFDVEVIQIVEPRRGDDQGNRVKNPVTSG